MKAGNKGIASWFGVRPVAPRTPALGSRELAVLDVLWRQGELAAQDVRAGLTSADIGLSTVQTTLERLHRKGLLTRTKRGRAYRYAAAVSKSTIISNLLRDIAADIAGGDTTVMVSGFMDYMAGERTADEPEQEGGSDA